MLNDPSEAIGIHARTKPVMTELPLEVGTTALIFTDGVWTAGERHGERFSLAARTSQLIQAGSDQPQFLADSLLQEAMDLDRGRPADDMTLVVLGIRPGRAARPGAAHGGQLPGLIHAQMLAHDKAQRRNRSGVLPLGVTRRLCVSLLTRLPSGVMVWRAMQSQPVPTRAAIVKVVGPCKSGKSTLVAGLRAAGYAARGCGQEHSEAPTMWQRIVPPDYLIFLDVTPQTQQARVNRSDWSDDTDAHAATPPGPCPPAR